MNSQEIKIAVHDKVQILTLDNPSSMNALSLSMATQLKAAIEAAQSTARVIIVTGAGNAFCSGANLSAERMEELQQGDIGRALENVYNPLFQTIRNSDIPIICAINGPAVGIGCPLALLGDVIIATPQSYFMQGFLNIGLIPDGGSAYLLARTIGRVKAMEMMLLGNKMGADEAQNRGLITQIESQENLIQTALNIAQKLAKGPKTAIKLMRQSAWAALDNDFIEQLSRERQLQKQAGNEKDFLEGVTAFMQKRSPNFEA